MNAPDGIPLVGWLIPHPAPKGILILLHGFGTSKADLLDTACVFHARGSYHLVLMDFRAHGASGGETISFGKKEVDDLKTLLVFLAGRPDLADLPVGFYGISMGGAIAILAAARCPQVKAVVTDSAYADLSHAIARAQRLTYHILRWPLGQMVLWGVELRLGCRLKELSPAGAIGAIAPRPILIIHGGRDISIAPGQAAKLFKLAGQAKEFWLVPEAEHVGAFYLERERYAKRVLSFFDRHLS
ncbi:MAG: alpha/beta hydrolase [Candidatus Omnitrophica bacterium]|nr:alpha/beta hydrolase [Candidatus Omnitrophota bacterium]